MRSQVLALLVMTGCASLDTNLTVKDRPLPRAWARAGTGPSIAKLSWKGYFADAQLSALIAEALANNPDRAIALQRIELARAGVRRATGALLPRLDASVGSGVRKFGLYTMDGAGNATTEITPGQLVPVHLGDFALGLQASWEIDLWGKLRNQREAALARSLATVEGSNLVVTSLVADVAIAWYELLALDRLATTTHDTAQRQREGLEFVRLQKEAGHVTELAVQQFEVQLASTKALEASVAQQRLEAENRLNLLLGRAPRPIERPADLSFEPPAPVSAGLPAELLRARPDVRAAELELVAAGADLESARAAFFPNITLGAGLGVQAFNPAFLVRLPESLIYSVAGGLVGPLLNRSALEADFDAAKALKLEGLFAYQKATLAAYVEVANALADLETTQTLVTVRREQRATVARAIDTADLLFRAGKANALEVLVAQQAALQTEVELVEAWRRQRVASVTIYRALGGGWQEP